MFAKILVTLDGSEFSERALEPALAIAKRFGASVLLLRVPVTETQPALPYGYGAAELMDHNFTRVREECEGYLYSMKSRFYNTGVSIKTEVLSGLPSEAILDVAEVEQVDLIVMSTHGRSGLSRLLQGSVAESVLRGAHAPVLLIPIK